MGRRPRNPTPITYRHRTVSERLRLAASAVICHPDVAIYLVRLSPLMTLLNSWRVRRSIYLLRRVRASLALRGFRGTLERAREIVVRRQAAPDRTLELLPLDAPFAPFALPVAAAPRVSVIIPVYGQIAHTLACLRSIARHGAKAPFDVVLVDDASPDDSVATLARIDGLRLLRNTRNLGFVGTCNAGAAAARGEFLLFLNNDTQVTAGWLDALLACFSESTDCGIAGARLVYPDGRLQEAGGLVFADGSAWNVGRFDGRDDPRFAYRREVDYVSGAALMIPRLLFAEIGGFDTRYAPAYYEDVDLAFAVRAHGRKVIYQPASLIMHDEGASAGTDLDVGMKRHQRINQARFVAKWQAALAAQPPPGTPLVRTMQRHRRGRVLVVDVTTPEVSRDSGSLRLIEILRLLHAQGWAVSFLPEDGCADAAARAALGAFGVEVLSKPWVRHLPDWLRRHGPELHAVMLCRHTVAGTYANVVRRHAPQARLLFDTVDLHFLRERRAAELSGDAALARQAEASRRSELDLIAHSDVSFVVSAYEHDLLRAELPQASVEVLSNIHRVRPTGGKPHAERRDLVFIGGWQHPPNADAIEWIAGEILPRLREALPDICVHLLGDMPAAVRTRFAAVPGLAVHGRVEALEPWLDRCLAALAPLRFGAGVKGKINTAMSHGLPVIATPLAIEGMHLVPNHDVILAENAAGFVSAAWRLTRDGAHWQRLAEHGRENVRRYFSPQAATAALARALG